MAVLEQMSWVRERVGGTERSSTDGEFALDVSFELGEDVGEQKTDHVVFCLNGFLELELQCVNEEGRN